jgi:two-component system, OmpR family, response regulator
MFPNIKKILIADEDAETRQLLSSILRKEGFFPIEAANAPEAYRLIRSKTEFTAVIFDILMPNILPVELLSFIRSEERLSHLPVLTTAAEAGIQEIQECFANGTTMFLPKPFIGERVHSALLILLNSHLKRIQRRRSFAA